MLLSPLITLLIAMSDRTPLIVLASLLLLFTACSRAFDPDIRTGSHIRMSDGQPQMILSAIAYFDDQNQPVIDVNMDIVYSSLIYREVDGTQQANLTVQTEIYRVIDESEDEYERVEMFRESLEVNEEESSSADRRDVFTYSTRIPIEPGKYRVVTQVTDQSSDKSVSRTSNVSVYDPDNESPNLTHVKVQGRDQSNEVFDLPLTTYSIPGRIDTINFEFQVTRTENSDPLEVEMRLVQFESDTLPPRSMSAVTPTRGSIQYRGINYNSREVLESQQRVLDQETGTITIEYRTERPPRGNYRFEVQVNPVDEEGDDELFKARDFASMSRNFPYVLSAREFAAPLIYLMRRGDYEDMMQIEDRDSLKRAIDRFWVSNLGDKELASRVIEKYYQRVEEANKQFSNFKEGWMTDMGMIYVLFGPPWYVEQSLDRMVWIYGYNRSDPRRVFYFQRTRMDSDSYPFEHYILQRNTQYHSVQYEQVQRWLSGTILTRPI